MQIWGSFFRWINPQLDLGTDALAPPATSWITRRSGYTRPSSWWRYRLWKLTHSDGNVPRQPRNTNIWLTGIAKRASTKWMGWRRLGLIVSSDGALIDPRRLSVDEYEAVWMQQRLSSVHWRETFMAFSNGCAVNTYGSCWRSRFLFS